MTIQKYVNPLNITEIACLILALDYSAYQHQKLTSVKDKLKRLKAALKQYFSPESFFGLAYFNKLESLERDLKDLISSVYEILPLLNNDGEKQLKIVLDSNELKQNHKKKLIAAKKKLVATKKKLIAA